MLLGQRQADHKERETERERQRERQRDRDRGRHRKEGRKEGNTRQKEEHVGKNKGTSAYGWREDNKRKKNECDI